MRTASRTAITRTQPNSAASTPQPPDVPEDRDQRLLCGVRPVLQRDRPAQPPDVRGQQVEQFLDGHPVAALGGPDERRQPLLGRPRDPHDFLLDRVSNGKRPRTLRTFHVTRITRGLGPDMRGSLPDRRAGGPARRNPPAERRDAPRTRKA